MSIVTIRIIETITMDTETNQIISSLRSIENSNGEVAKKATSPKVSKVEESLNYPVTLSDNKLILSKDCVSKLNLNVGDRVLVTYVEENNNFFPVISKSEVYGDNLSGNKLTKALSVSFRGNQQKQLSLYGVEFDLEEYDKLPNGAFKLKSTNEESLVTIDEKELASLDINVDSDVNLDKITEEISNYSEEIINFDFSFNKNIR